MYVLLPLLLLTLLVGALVDIIMSEQERIKYLPKFLWIVIVILTPLIGSILWFTIGRVYPRPVDRRSSGRGGFGRGGFGGARRGEQPPAAGDSLPGSSVLGYSGRDDAGLSRTEQELAALEREIAASEKEARIRKLEEELRARRERENPGKD